MKKRLNRFVADEARDWTRDLRFTQGNGRQSSGRGGLARRTSCKRCPFLGPPSTGAPFPPPALPGGTTSPSAIPVAPASFSRALPVSIPAGLIETDSLIRFHQPRPSSKPRVDSCIRLFKACSAFHSPYGLPSCLVAFSDLLHHRLQQSRCLHRWADAVFSI